MTIAVNVYNVRPLVPKHRHYGQEVRELYAMYSKQRVVNNVWHYFIWISSDVVIRVWVKDCEVFIGVVIRD